MGADLVKIKRRIASITSTRKVTNAMELVSSAKFRKKKKMMENVVDYSKMVEGIVFGCLQGNDDNDGDLVKLTKPNPEAKKDLYIAITSSLGLCGGYNFNLIRYLNTLIKEDDEVIMLGTKGLTKVADQKCKIDDQHATLLDDFNYSKVQVLRNLIVQSYTSNKYANVYLIYTHFKNALTFVPTQYRLLPFIPQEQQEASVGFPPIYCPSRKEVFKLLIPKYLDSIMFEMISESLVAEEGSRRNAMENATDNADDLKEQLNLTYNKARQAAITSQITEIMAGRLEDE